MNKYLFLEMFGKQQVFLPGRVIIYRKTDVLNVTVWLFSWEIIGKLSYFRSTSNVTNSIDYCLSFNPLESKSDR